MTRPGRWSRAQVIEAVIAALEEGADGAVPMLAVADTLRRKDGRALDDGAARQSLSRPDAAGLPSLPISSRRIAIMPAQRRHRRCGDGGTGGTEGGSGAGRGNQYESHDAKRISPWPKALAGLRRCAHAPWAMTRIASRDGDHVWLCGVKMPHDHGAGRPFRRRCRAACPHRRASWAASAQAISASIFRPRDERWRGAPSLEIPRPCRRPGARPKAASSFIATSP